MIEFLRLILHIIASLFKPRTKLVAEILVLRQQLNVPSPAGIEATTAEQYRSLSVCLALSLVPFRPQRDCDSPPRDDHPLASRGVPVLLARAITVARLIAPMRLRSSAEILGLPTGLRSKRSCNVIEIAGICRLIAPNHTQSDKGSNPSCIFWALCIRQIPTIRSARAEPYLGPNAHSWVNACKSYAKWVRAP